MATASRAMKIGRGDVQYNFSDGSTIIWNGNDGVQADNNPANLVTGSYPDIGEYKGPYIFSIFQSRTIGINDLENYLLTAHSISTALRVNPGLTIGDISGSALFGGQTTDPVTGGYRNPDTSIHSDYPEIQDFIPNGASLSYKEVLKNHTWFTLWVESIIQAEGSNDHSHGDINLPGGELITFSNAYDVNFVSPTFGGTEIDLGNDLATKAIDGSFWYSQNTQDKTATFSSNISTSYSSIFDLSINQHIRDTVGDPTHYPTTTAPNFKLGMSDTDTFYQLGDGTTIYAGSKDYELSISTDGTLYYNQANNDGIMLPPNFLANPNDPITGKMGSTDLIIINADNVSYTGSLENQIIIAAGAGDILNAGGTNETLLYLGGTNNSINEASTFSNVTIITPQGLSSSVDNNTLFAHSGTNVLIGDLGHNSFVVNPTTTSDANIIWGGGGTSTYDISGGFIDILYTNGTPTTQEIQKLSVSSLEQTLPSNFYFDPFGPINLGPPSGPITYIIDPTQNDTLIIPDFVYGSPGTTASLSGTYDFVPVTNARSPDPGYYQLNGKYLPVGLPVSATTPYNGDISLGVVSTGDNSLMPSVNLINFSNGDLGMHFTGGSPTYSGKKIINIGSGPGGGTITSGETEYVPAAATASGIVIASGGTLDVLSGGLAEATSINGGALVVSGSAPGITMINGAASIAGGAATVTIANQANATIIAAGNATVGINFLQTSPGGRLDFVNNSNSVATVFGGSEGSVTAFGGAGGGYLQSGMKGNSLLVGGAGVVTLIGSGAGDTLRANSHAAQNDLFAQAANETLTASSLTGANLFAIDANSYGLVSTAGSGTQSFFLEQNSRETTTITGSAAAPFNVYNVFDDSTAGGGNYIITNFRNPGSIIYLMDNSDNAPGDATVSSIITDPTYGAGNTLITLSDNTKFHLLGLSAGSVYQGRTSNGIIYFNS